MTPKELCDILRHNKKFNKIKAMNEITTDQALIIDELTFKNYLWNKKDNPRIKVSSWAKVYGEMVYAMEARVIAETKNLKIATS